MLVKLEPRYDQELLQYIQWIVVDVDSFIIGVVVVDFGDFVLMDLLMDLPFMVVLPRCNAYNTCGVVLRC